MREGGGGEKERQTDRQAIRQINRQTNRQTEQQTVADSDFIGMTIFGYGLIFQTLPADLLYTNLRYQQESTISPTYE